MEWFCLYNEKLLKIPLTLYSIVYNILPSSNAAHFGSWEKILSSSKESKGYQYFGVKHIASRFRYLPMFKNKPKIEKTPR